MTRKHQTAEYQRNARIVRARVAAMHKAGMPALCWRGGGRILPGTPYDVGHRHGVYGNSLGALAPEHRHRTPGCCEGNRREGGRVGAMLTNKTPAKIVHNDGNVQSWAL
jgi:hypothetical protein